MKRTRFVVVSAAFLLAVAFGPAAAHPPSGCSGARHVHVPCTFTHELHPLPTHLGTVLAAGLGLTSITLTQGSTTIASCVGPRACTSSSPFPATDQTPFTCTVLGTGVVLFSCSVSP